MGVNVDEAGADHMVPGIYGPGRLDRRKVSPQDVQLVALDPNGGVVPRASRAVYYQSVLDNEV